MTRARVRGARPQVSAVKAQLGELRGGLKRIADEILAAAGLSGAATEAHAAFRDHMAAFQQQAQPHFRDLEARARRCLPDTPPPPPPIPPNPLAPPTYLTRAPAATPP